MSEDDCEIQPEEGASLLDGDLEMHTYVKEVLNKADVVRQEPLLPGKVAELPEAGEADEIKSERQLFMSLTELAASYLSNVIGQW